MVEAHNNNLVIMNRINLPQWMLNGVMAIVFLAALPR